MKFLEVRDVNNYYLVWRYQESLIFLKDQVKLINIKNINEIVNYFNCFDYKKIVSFTDNDIEGTLIYVNVSEPKSEFYLSDILPKQLAYDYVSFKLFRYINENCFIKYNSNYKRMVAGALYCSADDPLLRKMHVYALEQVKKYNNLKPTDLENKVKIIKNLFGSVGDNVWLEPSIRTDYGKHINVGDNLYVNADSVFLDVAPIYIGNNVYIAPRVCFFTAGHPITYNVRNKNLEFGQPISVGDNVWIGGNVVINPGVFIGSNVVIGSGSVVTKDIPSNSIAVGNPCKVIRSITEEDAKKWQIKEEDYYLDIK